MINVGLAQAHPNYRLMYPGLETDDVTPIA